MLYHWLLDPVLPSPYWVKQTDSPVPLLVMGIQRVLPLSQVLLKAGQERYEGHCLPGGGSITWQ